MLPTSLLADATSTAPYRALMTVHVIAAIIWVGSGFFFLMQAERAKRAKKDANLIEFATSAEFWTSRIFVPSSVVLLICGVSMVIVGHVGFNKPFVDVGLVGWLVSLGIGTGYLGPKAGQAAELIEAAGGELTMEARSRIVTILRVARIDIVILFVVVAFMVIQPWGGA